MNLFKNVFLYTHAHFYNADQVIEKKWYWGESKVLQ